MRSRLRQRSTTWSRAMAALCRAAALAVLGLACAPLTTRPEVVIGTASPTGLYYPLGGSICRLLNLDTSRHGLRCAEEPSSGPVTNVESLRRGRLDIGIVPSDVLADAVAGQGSFASRGPAPGLRILFAGPDEMLTIVARTGLGIRTVAETRGTRINIGAPGSRQRVTMDRVMAALGLDRSAFADVRELAAAEQYRTFCREEVDVIVYSVGHPSGLIHDVTRTCHGTLVAVSGPVIERVLSEQPGYERALIPGGTYSGTPADVRTLGVRAVVVTSPRVSDTVAYEITRAVFEHFDAFRRLHPAFEGLTVGEMVHPRDGAPVHPAAMRYYRERGWLP
jgi:uncharacterized protein